MKIVFYDLETSGLIKEKHEIIQFAGIACKYIDGHLEILERFEIKMNFDLTADTEEALALNSYDADVWSKEAVDQISGLSKIKLFFERHKDVERVAAKNGHKFYNTRTCGHNILKFDDEFIRFQFEKVGAGFCPIDFGQIFDTLQLAKWYFFDKQDKPEDYSLTSLAKFFNVSATGAHDALNDIVINIKVCSKLRQH